MFTRIFLLTLISSIILTFDAVDIPKRFLSIPKCDGEISAKLNITKIKQNLELNGFVLIPGKDMKNLLIQHGASREDMAVLESGYIHQHLPIDQQPVMGLRLVRQG